MSNKGSICNLDFERIFLMLNPEQWAILAMNNIVSCILKHFNNVV